MPAIDLFPLSMTTWSRSIANYTRRRLTVTVYENTPALRKSCIYELLGPRMTRYMDPRYSNSRATHVGNKRIKFCSSESCTSRTRYLKDSGKRGRTEKASLTSRIQTLCAEQPEGVKFRAVCESLEGGTRTCAKCQAP